MVSRPEQECQSCKRLLAIVAQQEAQLAQLEALVTRQQAIIAKLQERIARLEKDSSNSHKPPSSDIVKPKRDKPRSAGKRRTGAQPGHRRHERTPFAPEDIDETRYHTLDGGCPTCGGILEPTRQDSRVLLQQVELRHKPVVITEHRAPVYWCARCREHRQANLPGHLQNAGLAGAGLTALVGWLKGAAHMSYSNIQAFLRDVLGVDFATGYLAKLVRKAGDALDAAYTGLLKALPDQTFLNVDETGHKECGNKWWTWCLRAPEFTVFKIDESRGSKVLLDVLGDEFNGVLGCDYFSAYRKYMKDVGCQVQFCLAHLIRDVKYLTTLGGRDRKYGERLLDCLRDLFHTIHQREGIRPARFRRAMERRRKRLIHVATHPPWTSKAQNIAERFCRHGESYVRFITTPGIEPTNNVVERALRFVVMQRRMTQGTRGKAGRTWSERIWTTVATCRQQGRSIYEFLHNALDAHFAGQPAPSLLPP